MQFPSLCPEVPVGELESAVVHYRDRLGFAVDWVAGDIGLAGLSRGDARLFLANENYAAASGTRPPIVVWVNMASRSEVDALHAEWAAAGADIDAAPSAQPYGLYEFVARDPAGNRLRAFYDFRTGGG